MKKATVVSSKHFPVGEVDKRVFGSFVEHLGRAVYGGIYDPACPSADADGFRKDVIDAVRKLGVSCVRYPGGNFVSGYRWEDGVGDRAKRPKKRELAWSVIETNEIGTDEFMKWCSKSGTEPMMSVNLGTRGAQDAANLLEYCNCEAGSYYSDMRVKNGHKDPYGVKLWCLGNEMDGPWQIGHKSADGYGALAADTARHMRMLDPDLELVVCGSSNRDMDTYCDWERTVLEHCYEVVDYLSLHTYYGNQADDTADFLARPDDMDAFIRDIIAVCDSVKAKKRSNKTINLSFDEWNVWFHSAEADKQIQKWQNVAPLLEDIYNFEDALVTASMLMSILRHCDRVKIACLAQLVNVIAPIFTKTGGDMFLQTIFYPFEELSVLSGGTVRDAKISCDTYDTNSHKNVPIVDGIVGEKDGKLYLFAVNRSLTDDVTIDFVTPDEKWTAKEHRELYCDDLKAVNTFGDERVRTQKVPVGKSITLKKHSFNTIVFERNGGKA